MNALFGAVLLAVLSGLLGGVVGERIGHHRGYAQMALRHEAAMAGVATVTNAMRQEVRAHGVRLAVIAAMDRQDAARVAWPPQCPLGTDEPVALSRLVTAGAP